MAPVDSPVSDGKCVAIFCPAPQILFEETLFQNASDGTPFVKMLQDKNIIPGIKVSGDHQTKSAISVLGAEEHAAGQGQCHQAAGRSATCHVLPRLVMPFVKQAAHMPLFAMFFCQQVDKGVVALPGTDGETETQGIDDLGKR